MVGGGTREKSIYWCVLPSGSCLLELLGEGNDEEILIFSHVPEYHSTLFWSPFSALSITSTLDTIAAKAA